MYRTPLIVGAVGVLFLALAGYLFLQEQLFLQKAQFTTAIVTENRLYTTYQFNQGGDPFYCSEFRFQTGDGQSVSFEEPGCANVNTPPDYQVGQKVDIYYDPADPKGTVQISKFSNQYSGPTAAAIAGSLVLILALVVYRAGLLRSRRVGA